MDRRWKGSRVLDMPIPAPVSSVSFLGAVRSALAGHGIEKDIVDIAGYSGYAFVVNTGPDLNRAMLTAFDWKALEQGITGFGIPVEIALVDCDMNDDAGVTGSGLSAEDRRLQEELFERIREEIDRGSVCVVWGAVPDPEFAVVCGYKDDKYLVRTSRSIRTETLDKLLQASDSPEPPVRFGELAALGRLGALFFGEPAGVLPVPCQSLAVDPVRADGQALVRAGQLLAGRHPCFEPGYISGWAGFGAWAGYLETGTCENQASTWLLNGFHELQLAGSEFCARLSRSYHRLSAPLSVAASCLKQSTERLDELRGKFCNWPGNEQPDTAFRRTAAQLLRGCEVDNREAAAALHDAAALF